MSTRSAVRPSTAAGPAALLTALPTALLAAMLTALLTALLIVLAGPPAVGAGPRADAGAVGRAPLADLPPRVVLTDLGFLGEGARAEQVNDRGVVIGTFFRAGSLRAFRWEDGVMAELPGLGGVDTGGTSINGIGQVAGFAQDAGGARRAVVWQPDGTLVDLGVAQSLGGTSSTATGINRRGTVVGTYVTGDEQRAFLWRDGVVADLGDLPPGARSHDRPMLNDRDQVVLEAASTDPPGLRLAFRWEDGVLTPLTVPGSLGGIPEAINRRGQVLGTAIVPDTAVIWDGAEVVARIPTLGGPFILPVAMEEDEVAGFGAAANGELHAFHWQDGVVTDLGTLGGPFSEAVALNGRGQVVGASNLPSTDRHATLWQDGHIVDLGTPGGPFSTAADINRRGQVVGHGLAADGTTHAVLWTVERGRR